MDESLYLLGLDFETQCEKSKTTNITEVGASLIKWTPKKYEKVAGISYLCYEPEYPPQTPKIVELTSIDDEMLKTCGKPRKEIFEQKLLPLVSMADIIFCHKVNFDRTVFESTCIRLGLPVPVKEYVCTLTNFDWAEKYTCKKLSHLAYDHSILVDPATLHRAEADVDLMMRLVLEKYDLQKVLEYARKPWKFIRAFPIEPWKDGEVQTTIAKKLNFSWQKIRYFDEYNFPKMWVQRVKADKVDEIKKAVSESASPFRVSEIEGI